MKQLLSPSSAPHGLVAGNFAVTLQTQCPGLRHGTWPPPSARCDGEGGTTLQLSRAAEREIRGMRGRKAPPRSAVSLVLLAILLFAPPCSGAGRQAARRNAGIEKLLDDGDDDGDGVFSRAEARAMLELQHASKIELLLAAPVEAASVTAAAADDACIEGWQGELCDECAPGFGGDMCTKGGAAVANGDEEQCLEGWAGEDCDECAPGFGGDMCTKEGNCGEVSNEELGRLLQFPSAPAVRLSLPPPEWDSNGYVVTHYCQGRFGNQFDYLLGLIEIALKSNRTLLLPPFTDYSSKVTPPTLTH